eukprot:996502-Prymnesium_polylepis.1
MVMLAKAFAGTDAVGGEDADVLKRIQQISQAVQQELNRLPAPAHAAVVMTARGRAAASTAASSLGLITQLLGQISSKRTLRERGSSEASLATADAVELLSSAYVRMGAETRAVHSAETRVFAAHRASVVQATRHATRCSMSISGCQTAGCQT